MIPMLIGRFLIQSLRIKGTGLELNLLRLFFLAWRIREDPGGSREEEESGDLK